MRRLGLLFAASWIFLPSTYSHKDGQRVSQYSEPPKAYVQPGRIETLHYNHRHTYQSGAGGWEYDSWYNKSVSP